LIFTLKNPFSTNFDPNTRRKHLKNLIKPIHSHQKPNKSPQNLKSTRNKIFSQAQIFLGVFKVKKNPKWNPPHHMQPFDTKHNRFGGHNLPQRLLSLSKPEYNDSLSPLRTKKD
jgi:hypothetical protein